MLTRFVRFNIIFWLLAGLVAATGCQSAKKSEEKKKKKELTIVEFHLESTPDGLNDTDSITVNRREPMSLNVDKEPFIDNTGIGSAKLIDEGEGIFSIQINFNMAGKLRLDINTMSHRGKHIAIYCAWGPKRWIAAPVIRGHMGDGVILFTPDTTHEEAERIVRGINNSVEKLKDDTKW